jgi:hypothetical protein
VFIVLAYQASQYVMPRGSICLSKRRSSFAGSSDGKMNVQSACTLNTLYNDTSIMKHHSHMTVFLAIRRKQSTCRAKPKIWNIFRYEAEKLLALTQSQSAFMQTGDDPAASRTESRIN